MASIFRSIYILLVAFSLSFGDAAVPANTTVGQFGPLVSYQPVDNWLYPTDHTIPIKISLGNSSLAL